MIFILLIKNTIIFPFEMSEILESNVPEPGEMEPSRSRSRSRDRSGSAAAQSKETLRPESGNNRVVDPLLRELNDDPRGGGPRIRHKGAGRNTESFDPRSTLVRPSMRIVVGSKTETFTKPLKHDDVVVVPEFFCEEGNWDLYYKLVEEIRESNQEKGEDWVSWHEGAHLIAKNYESSPTFKAIRDKIAKYFNISNKSVGTRLNWYRDSSDWKPFHHDSAAFNPQRAKNQNITVGVSFGSERELSFLHAETGQRVYFPQVCVCLCLCLNCCFNINICICANSSSRYHTCRPMACSSALGVM